MPHEQPTSDDTAPHSAPGQHTPSDAQPAPAAAYATVEEGDDWLDEPVELPPRPRRRLLGQGANPVALVLLAVLLIACGFIGGVLVEKGESSSSSSGAASSLASRFAALRGGASSTSARSGAGAGAGGFAGAFAGAGAGGTRPTAGTVAYLDGSTLYVTNDEGNTIKVSTSAATSVNKTVKASVAGIHPGETVTITGASGSGGTVNAESISVGSGGGLAALFGAGKSGGSSGSSGGGGEAALFGSG
jgi:hypothetical protein